MTYRRRERMPEYSNADEREAYTIGYASGYARLSRPGTSLPRSVPAMFPNAYNKGYWDGYADSEGVDTRIKG
jgi:hypothetical protein